MLARYTGLGLSSGDPHTALARTTHAGTPADTREDVVDRDELLAWIDDYLEVERFQDYSPIGLQVEGRDQISRVALGVSAHLGIIEEAAEWGADALLVHHGFFWSGEPVVLRGWRKRRIRALFDAEMTLASYHLPLDAHPEVGNNAQLADVLGLPTENRQLFGLAKGVPIGLIGDLGEPRAVTALLDKLREHLGGEPLTFLEGPDMVSKIAIVTGGGAGFFEQAVARGAQLLLTGEAREPTMAEASEMGAHFVAAGHYRTETVGIRALGEKISSQWGLECRFFEWTNPV
jgi:dinuclear metal center YbgI/SA1388 family protein